jgi:drug/metabolite transporter (DMT)-like permease
MEAETTTHPKRPSWLRQWSAVTPWGSTAVRKGTSSFELAVFISILIQGMNNIVTKLVLLHFHPWVFIAVRNGLSVVIGWLILWYQERQIRHLLWGWKPFFLPGVMGRGLSAICWSLGLTYTSASNAALISCSTPIFTTLYMVLTKQEPMTGRGWAGIAISISGIYLVVTQGQGLSIAWEHLYGDLLILMGSLAWSYYLIMVKKRIGEQHTVLQVTFLSMTTGLAILVPVGASQLHGQAWEAIPFQTWALLGYIVLGSMVISSLLWTWGVANLGLNRTVIYQYLTPVITVIGARIVLGEPMSGAKILGGALVLGGIYLARRR